MAAPRPRRRVRRYLGSKSWGWSLEDTKFTCRSERGTLMAKARVRHLCTPCQWELELVNFSWTGKPFCPKTQEPEPEPTDHTYT